VDVSNPPLALYADDVFDMKDVNYVTTDPGMYFVRCL